MVCEYYHDSLIDLPERPVSVDPEKIEAICLSELGGTVDGVKDCGTTRMGNWAGCQLADVYEGLGKHLML